VRGRLLGKRTGRHHAHKVCEPDRGGLDFLGQKLGGLAEWGRSSSFVLPVYRKFEIQDLTDYITGKYLG
jgi:hypothetical protein